jgi:rfaE bifunctional protein kinase chain/domain
MTSTPAASTTVRGTLDSLRSARVLVVGDVMLDRYWFGEVDRISPEAPVPVVKVARTEERLGGAANVARNAAALGAQVSLLSVVGDDEAARSMERLLAEEGIDASMQRDPAVTTTVKLRVIGRQQQLLRIDFETPPGREALDSKLAEFERRLPTCDVVIIRLRQGRPRAHRADDRPRAGRRPDCSRRSER